MFTSAGFLKQSQLAKLARAASLPGILFVASICILRFEASGPRYFAGSRRFTRARARLAWLMNVRPQEVNRLTTLRHPTKIDTVADALKALGRRLDLSLA